MVSTRSNANAPTNPAAPGLTRGTRPVGYWTVRHRSPDDAVHLFVHVEFGQTVALSVVGHTDGDRLRALCDGHRDLKQGFADEARGDIPALFVLRVAAASTSEDGHTGRFVEDVGGSTELPAHVHTHLSGHALSLPPLRLYTFEHIQVEVGSSERGLVCVCQRPGSSRLGLGHVFGRGGRCREFGPAFESCPK